ncbi:nucleotidyltransferase domain-containing protein [Brevibacillus migulae]|uniref:nucleotidyltransferase domain-containing protein n=1 Tax=Brevibacillus migulae TaxID=1644114 RepID=UPI00106E191D|nr:nucleotidyltransferase domain-containing protein [Brevibacillus migulae]
MNEQLLESIMQQEPFLQDHLLCLAYAGSRSYGTETAASDIDLRGIAFAPWHTVLGLDTYEQTMLKVPDMVVYALKKYVQLAMKGNPNILELLFIDREDTLVLTAYGEELRASRGLFVTKKVFHSFGGYAIRNIRKLSERSSSDYDGKDASHLIRLLQTGKELLAEGAMQVKRPNWQELLAIKRGEWPLDELLAYADKCFAEMEKAYERTRLQEQADREAIEALIIRMQTEFYGDHLKR